tara:strand:- start:101 stop:496 length:396 start_codon:yes stop_codon:yes gene_type:complete
MKCKLCSKKTEHLELHHIVPISRGGTNNECNIIELCSGCHGLAHDVSFTNERGGLIKEGVIKKKIKDTVDRKWLEDNDSSVQKKMMRLYDKDKDMHVFMLLLLEQGRFNASHIRKWCEVGKVTFKTSITFF